MTTVTESVKDFLARLRAGVEDHEEYRKTNYAAGYLDALRMVELYVRALTTVEELTDAAASAATAGKEILEQVARLRETTERVAEVLGTLAERTEEAQDRAEDVAERRLVELPKKLRQEARKA